MGGDIPDDDEPERPGELAHGLFKMITYEKEKLEEEARWQRTSEEFRLAFLTTRDAGGVTAAEQKLFDEWRSVRAKRAAQLMQEVLVMLEDM